MNKIFKLLLIFLFLFPIYANAGNIVKEIGQRPEAEKIKNMVPGQVGYTVPWAVNRDNINPEYSLRPEPGGTVQLKVKCIGVGMYELDWTGVGIYELELDGVKNKLACGSMVKQ